MVPGLTKSLTNNKALRYIECHCLALYPNVPRVPGNLKTLNIIITLSSGSVMQLVIIPLFTEITAPAHPPHCGDIRKVITQFLFVCIEALRPCQQLKSCRAGQLPINIGQA